MELDATFWTTVGLFIFLGLVTYLKVPGKLLGSLDAHSNKIKNELDEARRLREEAQDLLASFQRKHDEAESEAERIVSQAKRTAEELVRETEEKAKAMLARKEKQAQDRIHQAEQEAIAELRSTAANAAIAAARDLLESDVKGAVASKLIDESIAGVSSNLN